MIGYLNSAAGVLLTCVAATSAHAQNNKPIRSGTFYEDRASGATSGTLTLKFAQTPTDKFFNITDISCFGASSTSAPFVQASLNIGTTSGGTEVGRSFGIAGSTFTATYATGEAFNFNAKMFIKVGPGRFPNIVIALSKNNASANTADCQLVGTLSDD